MTDLTAEKTKSLSAALGGILQEKIVEKYTAKQFENFISLMLCLCTGIAFFGNLYSIILIVFPSYSFGGFFDYYLPMLFGIITSFCSIYLGRWKIDFISRRRNCSHDTKSEAILKTVTNMIRLSILNFTWSASFPVHFGLIPFISNRYFTMGGNPIPLLGPVPEDVLNALVGSMTSVRFLCVIPIYVITFVLYSRIAANYRNYEVDIAEWSLEYSFRSLRLYRVFYPLEAPYVADLVLGKDIQTGEEVVIPMQERTLNLLIVGAIGTGKSATIFLPAFYQDIEKLIFYLKDYLMLKNNSKIKNEDILRKYLNGIIIIEPSNDLCRKAFELALKIGFPRELICYVDPENENSDSMNLFRGPVDKVAEVLTKVVSGMAKSDGGFFEQAQRIHLKQHVYLLKIASQHLGKIANFTNLVNMYSDIDVVWEYHQALKSKLEDMTKTRKANIQANRVVSKKEENRKLLDEDKYQIILGVKKYFDKLIVEERDKSGKIIRYDRYEQNVQGLRNIIDDIGTNAGMRRVLFREGEFDLDTHFKFGGILLINNSTKSLGSKMSANLGKLTSLTIHDAIYRREPNKEPLSVIEYDEHPAFFTEEFKDIISVSRKYGVAFQTAGQNMAQYEGRLDNPLFKDEILNLMRNKVVFGDVNTSDGKLFEGIFGTEKVYTKGLNITKPDALSDQDTHREAATYTRVEEPIFSCDDLQNLGAFEAVVRTMENKEPVRSKHISTNFVPKLEDIKPLFDIENDPSDKAVFEAIREDMRAYTELNAHSDIFDTDVVDEDITKGVERSVANDEIQRSGGLQDAAASSTMKTIAEYHKEEKKRTVSGQRPLFSQTDEEVSKKINSVGRKKVYEEVTENQSVESTKTSADFSSQRKEPLENDTGDSSNTTKSSIGESTSEIIIEEPEIIPGTESRKKDSEEIPEIIDLGCSNSSDEFDFQERGDNDSFGKGW